MPFHRTVRSVIGLLGQPGVLFALAIIALGWIAAVLTLDAERSSSRQSAIRETGNMAHVFESNVAWIGGEADKALRRLAMGQDRRLGRTMDWQERLFAARTVVTTPMDFTVIDEHGRQIATTSTALAAEPADFSGHESFLRHAENDGHNLLIGTPRQVEAGSPWLLDFSRRLNKLDGSFDGLVIATIEAATLTRFYSRVQHVREGGIALIGRDGVVRAAAGDGAVAVNQTLAVSRILRQVESSSQGLLDLPLGEGNAPDIAFYRWIDGQPLFVVAWSAGYSGDADLARVERYVLLGAIGLTLLGLVAMAVGLRHNRKLEQSKLRLALSEARASTKSRDLELTLNHMNQGIIMVDCEGKVGFINPQAVRLLGLPKTSLVRPHTFEELVAYQTSNGEFDHLPEAWHTDHYAPGQAALVGVYERARPDGTVIEVRTEPLADGGFVRTFTDVTRRHQSEAQMRHLAGHDALTGLANRFQFNQRLTRTLEDLKHDDQIALHCIDLDLFKSVNDTLGHVIGDKLLQVVAGRLRQAVREEDLVARLGGDEFAIVQRICAARDASHLADRVMSVLKAPFMIEGHTIETAASIGVAFAPTDATTVEGLLRAADLALYAAKASGRSACQFYASELNERAQDRRRLEMDLRRAVMEGQFEIYYQPMHVVSSEEIAGFEALLRWRHPTRGYIAPSEFIPVAEDLGLIVPLGAWVLKQACLELAALPGHLRMAVNLSPLQFRSNELVGQVRSALDAAGISPDRLILEITETTLLQRDDSTAAQLNDLRSLGVRIALDDFGTGYSSLSHLAGIPVDVLKIDRSFVSGLGLRPDSEVIIRAINDIASSLGMTTTAEGVETQEQLDRLRALGCAEAQGYLWSPARPSVEIRSLFNAEASKDTDQGARPKSGDEQEAA